MTVNCDKWLVTEKRNQSNTLMTKSWNFKNNKQFEHYINDFRLAELIIIKLNKTFTAMIKQEKDILIYDLDLQETLSFDSDELL